MTFYQPKLKFKHISLPQNCSSYLQKRKKKFVVVSTIELNEESFVKVTRDPLDEMLYFVQIG